MQSKKNKNHFEKKTDSDKLPSQKGRTTESKQEKTEYQKHNTECKI